MNRFAGMDVYANCHMTKHIRCVVLPPKTWVDKVLSWNPCNVPTPPLDVPSDQVLIIGNSIIAHPAIIQMMGRGLRMTEDTRNYA